MKASPYRLFNVSIVSVALGVRWQARSSSLDRLTLVYLRQEIGDGIFHCTITFSQDRSLYGEPRVSLHITSSGDADLPSPVGKRNVGASGCDPRRA